MDAHYILSDYIDRAMAQAEYDKLEDNSFAGRIASCKGVLAFGATLKECGDELRSTLEDWILVGLKLSISLWSMTIIALRFAQTKNILCHSCG